MITHPPMFVWWLMRGSGVVALVLLTATVLLGIATTMRWRPQARPRWVTRGLHRNVSLLSLSFLAIHALTAIVDGDAHVSTMATLVPFTAPGHGLPLATGIIAGDLVLALLITSGVRRIIGQRAWRFVHWGAYASWPLAVIHGISMGTDLTAFWLDAVTAACVGAVLWGLAWRLPREPVKALSGQRGSR